MFSVPDQTRMKASELLRGLQVDADTTVRTVVQQLGDRTYGVALLFMTAFNMIPLLNNLFAILTVLIVLQMLVGRKSIWLPRRVLDIHLPEQKTQTALLKASNAVQRVERWCVPRWRWTELRVVGIVLSLILLMLAFLVVLIPVPLANVPPSIVIGLIAVGLTARDGLYQLVGAVLGCLMMLFYSSLLLRLFGV